MTNATLYREIGFATVEEAQDICFELARARIGPETVQQICAVMMQFYFGKGAETYKYDTLAALRAQAPLRVHCNLQRYEEDSILACTGSSWNDYGHSCLKAVEVLTLHVEVLIRYAELFRREMKSRGLVLTFASTDRYYQYCKISLEPDSGVYVAR